MAFLMVQAGGRAIDGHVNILDIQPTKLHQRTAIYIGSTRLINRVDEFVARYNEVEI
jgi:fructose-1,6-bisphosphatase I